MMSPQASQSIETVIIWHGSSTPDHDDVPNSPSDEIQAITELLHSKGHKTAVFEQRHQVSENITALRASLVLIHLQTSGDQGYDLCQKLREQADTHHLPIVFISSSTDNSERMNVLRCGGSAYLQSPVSLEECWLSLQQHLQTAQLVRRLQVDRMTLSQQVDEYSQIVDQQAQIQRSLTQKNQALHKLAFVDGLTQVANRRSFNQTLAERWREAYTNRQPLSLLLCDIDYFKRYNDAYGHVGGDRCLRAVAEALVLGTHRREKNKEHGREQSQVSRYGGEEFAIILPNTRSSGAERVALSIQTAVARAQIPHKSSLIKAFISLSIGVFTMVPDSALHPPEMLVHGADKALYTAKLWGRDRTVINTGKALLSIQTQDELHNDIQTFSASSHVAPAYPITEGKVQAPDKFSLNQHSVLQKYKQSLRTKVTEQTSQPWLS